MSSYTITFTSSYFQDQTFIDGKIKQKYFYKKYAGEPIKKRQAIEIIESELPNISNVMSHPVWELFSLEKLSFEAMLNLAKRLPFSVQRHMLTSDGSEFVYRENILSFLEKNTYDALTAVLLVQYARETEKTFYELKLLSQELLRFVIRFFAGRNTDLGFKVISGLIDLFNLNKLSSDYSPVFTLYNEKTSSTVIIDKFPLYLHQITNEEKLSKSINIYQQIYQKIISIKAITAHNNDFLNVMTYVKHSSLPELCNELTSFSGALTSKSRKSLWFINSKLGCKELLDDLAQRKEPKNHIHLYR